MERRYNLIDLVQELNVDGNLKDNEYEKYIQSNDLIHQICIHSSTFFVFLDLKKMVYQYVSPSIKLVLGYTPDVLIKKGVDIIFKNFHPSTLLTQKAIHNSVNQVIDDSEGKEKLKLKFSYNVRIKHAKGYYVWLLQRDKLLKLDKNGKPLLMLMICTAINEYVSNERQTFVVSKIENGKEKIVMVKHFFPEFENGILTRREMEVWRLLNEGCSSKDIAEKLDMKVNTVFTHRKKINKKLKNKDQ